MQIIVDVVFTMGINFHHINFHSVRNNPSEGNTLFLYVETSLELKSGDSEIIIEHLGAAVTDCLKTLKIDLPISKINQSRLVDTIYYIVTLSR